LELQRPSRPPGSVARNAARRGIICCGRRSKK
jgi:hypothetical protein